MARTFIIPAAEAYKSVANSDHATEITSVINGLLSLDISRHFEDKEGEAGSLMQLGIAYLAQGNLDDSLRSLSQALVLFRELHDRDGECMTLVELARVHSARRDFEGAIAAATSALTLARDLDDPLDEARSQHELGRAHMANAHFDTSIHAVTIALQLFRELADRNGEMRTLADLARIASAQSRFKDAVAFSTQALGMSRSLDDLPGEANSLLLRATATGQLVAGQTDEGRQLRAAVVDLDEARIIYRKLGDAQKSAQCAIMLSIAYARSDDYPAAIRAAQEAAEEFGIVGDDAGVQRCSTYISKYQARQSFDAEALQDD